MEIYNQEIEISTEFIKLDQLLKLAQIADSGAVAKEMVLDGICSVNGECCTMRGKKLYPGDKVAAEFDEELFEITVINKNESE